jgi:Uma2 family endonuclease
MALLQSAVVVDPKELEPERIRPLQRAEYDRMVELGFFGDDERVELLRGALVAMSPQGPVHAYVIERLNKLLIEAVGDRARVRPQAPFAASDLSEPEPDLAVYPPGHDVRTHPREALLVVEIADSSLRKDRGIKSEIYAEAAVPEYWIVDLVHEVVEVRTDPSNGRYARLDVRRRGERVALASLPDVVLAVAEFLPPPP